MNLGIGIGILFKNSMGGGVFEQMLKLADVSVARASSRTVWGYPADGVIADGMSLLTVPDNIVAFTGGRLLTTVADGAELGDEKAIDGDFSVPASWSVQENAGITGGELVNTIAGNGTLCFQGEATIGQRYFIGFDIVEKTQGSLYARVGQVSSASVTDVGHHDCEVVAASINGWGVGGSNWIGKVDNFTIKEVIPTWSAVDADDAALNPAVSVADAGTNKVICREANPIDTSNITIDSGDGAITVVDSTAALAAAGLDQVCTLDDVYQLTGGSVGTIYSIAGQTGNTNKHSLQAQTRKTAGTGTSSMQLGAATGVVEITGAAFSKLTSEGLTPAGATEVMKFSVAAGDTVEMIFPQLEENTVATPPVYNDALSTATRAADVITTPTPGVLSASSGAVEFTVTPNKTGQTGKYALGSTVDASNLLAVELNATTIDLIKKVIGTDYVAQEAYTHAKDTKARIQIYWGASGTGIRAADSSADITALSFHTNANALTMPLDTNFEIGNQGGVNLFVGDDPVADFKFYTSKFAAGWS